ncbi:hypothetical protein Taro_023864 [Colocasia esculenta]|uniref:Uncharacterized protein n=1 Tax=Colocasia esculenta TaxID=4460 RepID=A0A843V599_COLES|nr:hypothetical protein [Colocasia esculenta]
MESSRPGRRPCERDGPIGRIHKGHHDSALCRDLIVTGLVVPICCPTRVSLSRPVQAPVAISVDPVATLIRGKSQQLKSFHGAMGFPGETEDEAYTQEDGNDLE